MSQLRKRDRDRDRDRESAVGSILNHDSTQNRALSKCSGTYVVTRPEPSPFSAALASFTRRFKVVNRSFLPKRGTLHIQDFTIDRREGLTPVSYSTDVDVLACYSAQLSDGSRRVVLLSGAFGPDNGENVWRRLQRTLCHQGSVEKHELTVVSTPTPLDRASQRDRFVQNSVSIPMLFRELLHIDNGAQPPLVITPIRLCGWKKNSKPQLPLCTFRSTGQGEHVELVVAWGSKPSESVSVNLTQPLNTFVPLPRR